MMSSDALAHAAGCTFRQIDCWARAGYLNPHPRAASSGVPRRWSAPESLIAVVMARLVRSGVAVPDAARIARTFIEHGTRSFDLVEGVHLSLTDAVARFDS